MDQRTQARTDAAGRPIHRACLVAGCPCKADGIVSTARTARLCGRGSSHRRDRRPTSLAANPPGDSSDCPLPDGSSHN